MTNDIDLARNVLETALLSGVTIEDLPAVVGVFSNLARPVEPPLVFTLPEELVSAPVYIPFEREGE